MKFMNVVVAAVGLAALSLNTVSAAEEVPAWQAEARKAFGEQRFGIFIHWGLYAMYAQGEWYQTGGIPRKEYATAAGGFYPSRFDARKWVKAFKQAGAKYVTFTARHHDGFSLFHTKYAQGDYDIAHTPFKRDICKELADACHAEGLQMNFYYSLMDWWRTDYPIGKSSVALVDKELNANADYASYKRFMINQLGELLTNYGPVGCIWLDGEGDHRDGTEWAIPGGWQFEEIYDFIHSHHALVGNNNNRPTREKEDIQFFEMSKDSTIEGARANRADKPFERCFTMQKGIWGYQIPCDLYYSDSTSSVHVVRGKFHPKPYMLQMLVKNAAKGVNLLLNVGPRIDGELSDECYAILDYMGQWLAVNGESIYATEAGPAADGEKVVTTQTKDAVYVHFLDPTVKEFSFPFARQPVSVSALDGGAAVPFTAADGQVTVRPTVPADAAAWTVKVLFK